MVHWTVYSRAECGLCEELLAELVRVLGREAILKIDVVDVDTDPQLQSKYGMRVPVLLADGEFVCAYRLDEARVKQHMIES